MDYNIPNKSQTVFRIGSISKKFIIKAPNEPLATFVAYTPLTAYSASDSDTYSGDYYCAELDVVYTLKAEEDGIMLYINGNAFGSVEQVMKDMLSRNSRLIFEFNETIDMFRLSMSRVKNLKFVKRLYTIANNGRRCMKSSVNNRFMKTLEIVTNFPHV